jgi:hypothetical protein
MSVYEERLKTLESEIIGLRIALEKFLSSTSPSLSKKTKNREKLLDLFGEWDGDIDDFLHDLSERRERRGRLG